jgi:hypothetical protein
MRQILASLGLVAACGWAAPVNAASAVSGHYLAGGQPAAITDVSAHADEPIDGKPITTLVFTTKPQNGDANASDDAHNGDLGDALIVRVAPKGNTEGADFVHHGLTRSNGYLTGAGLVSIRNFQVAGAQISGELTTGGPTDAWGQQIDVDLTFRTKAP